MMMKRILPLLFAFLLCLGLTACVDGSKEPSMDTIHNSKTGDTISLGMSRKDVERRLGKGTPFDYEAFWKKVKANSPSENENVGRSLSNEPATDFTYGEGDNYIAIFYENDAVLGFSTYSEDKPSNWALHDITHGSTLADVTKYLGENEKWPTNGSMPDGRTAYWLNYFFDANGKRVDDSTNASLNINIFIFEETDTLLSFSVFAFDHTKEIEWIKSIFESRDEVQIFDETGKDITAEFFRLHEDDYAKGDWQTIQNDLGERGLTVSHPES